MMTIIKPVDLAENMVVSNVPLDDAPVWVSKTYAEGDRVMHRLRVWEALTAIPAGVEPGAETVTPTAPAKWLDTGAVNRWRMFDDKVGTVTAREGSVVVDLQPGQAVTALAALNMNGLMLSVLMTDPAEGVVYEQDVSIVDVGAGNWYEYFFKPFTRTGDITLTDMPSYPSATTRVTVSSADIAEIGSLSIGTQDEIGMAVYGTSVGIVDYSRKVTDEFGNYSILERPFSKRAEYDVVLDTAQVSRVQRLLASIRAKPVVWIGEETMEATVVYGFFKDFSISISGPSVSDATITVEGLT